MLGCVSSRQSSAIEVVGATDFSETMQQWRESFTSFFRIPLVFCLHEQEPEQNKIAFLRKELCVVVLWGSTTV